MPRVLERHNLGFLFSWRLGFLFACVWLSSWGQAATNSLAWRWSNPTPFGANAADLACRSNRVYVAVCDHGEIYVSDDLSSWRRRSPGITNSLRAVTYQGDQILVSASGGVILTASGELFTPYYLGTTNSLEGIASSPNLAVTVGDHGAIYTSTSGTNWNQVAPPFTNWLRSIAFGNGIFAAVGEGGLVATSVDGTHWQKRPIPGFSSALNRVVWNGNGFTAVGQAGSAVWSTDATATSWTMATPLGATGDLYAIAVDTTNPSLSFQLAAGVSEVHLGSKVRNGFAWSNETSNARTAPAPLITYLSALWTGSEFILAAEGGVIVTGVRPDPLSGYNWTFPTTNLYGNIWDIATAAALQTNIVPFLATNVILYQTNFASNTNYFIAADNAGLASSEDGVNWPISFAPTGATGQNYLGIAAASDYLVAVGTGGIISFSPNNYTPVVTTSQFTNGTTTLTLSTTNYHTTLGLAWYGASSPVTTDLQGICYNSGQFLATGDAGVILTSTNGINWTRRKSGVTNFLSSACHGSNGWVTVGTGGIILSSPNGILWSVVARPTTHWLWRVREIDSHFFALGQNGSLFQNTGGNVWQSSTTGTTSWLNDICQVNGTYYVAGDDGLVLTSTNATTWRQLVPAFSSSTYALSSVNGQLIAAGSAGAILRAQVTPFGTPIQFIAWPHKSADNLFVLGGQLDQQFQVIHGTNLTHWVGSETLEIIDPGGTLIWLDPAPLDDTRQYFSVSAAP